MPANKSPSPTTTSITHRPQTLTSLTKYIKYPPAARHREILKLVHKFSGNGVHVFTHYTTPILDTRREALLSSGTTNKKYYKTASQLWTILDDEQKVFWDHQAKLIRLGIGNGTLSIEQCVEDAGLRSEWRECLKWAERAVGAYLGTAVPQGSEDMEHVENVDGDAEALVLSPQPTVDTAKAPETSTVEFNENGTTAPELLDTLRTSFTAEPRMVYGNFAQLYPYTLIHQAIGKHQTALLRQLADLLDPSGKEFFYYYATPHLWKSMRPTEVDQTIESAAHAVWMLMPGPMKREWQVASAQTKKLLGDGDLDGLERLQLERDCEEIWELHEMTEKALQVHMVK